jgi:FixJ family two-component response regulator
MESAATSHSPLATIFVVDDDASFLVAVSRLLRAGGYAVQTFSSSAEFLKRPLTDSRGCVVVDLRMPGPSGMELQAALEGADNPLPVIFLTGHGDISTSVRAMRRGAVDFLTKPVKKEALFDAVRRALALDASGRAQRERVGALRERYQALTPREREVLAHVVAGQLNKQIAGDLGTCERTIKAHRAAIMDKLGVESVADLVRFSQELGIQPVGGHG